MGKAHATTVKQQFEGFIPAVFLYARGRLKLGFDAFRRPVLHSSHYVCLKLVVWALSTNNRESFGRFFTYYLQLFYSSSLWTKPTLRRVIIPELAVGYQSIVCKKGRLKTGFPFFSDDLFLYFPFRIKAFSLSPCSSAAGL